jgi:hypothetical protein
MSIPRKEGIEADPGLKVEKFLNGSSSSNDLRINK